MKMNKKYSNKKTNGYSQLQVGDVITVKVDALAYGGQGLYKNNGLVLFIPRGLPKDVVKIKIKRIKKRYGTAEILAIIEPSPHRIASFCNSFDKGCGGCQWLEFDYREQLRWKTKIIRETFKHIGKISIKVNNTIGMSETKHSRNKLSLHQDNNGKIGLMREQSHDIIPFTGCIQEMQSIEKSCKTLLKFKLPRKISQIHFRSTPKGEVNLSFFQPRVDKKELGLLNKILKTIPAISGISIATFGGYIKSIGKQGLTVEIADLKYFVPSTAFFQTNYKQAKILLDLVHKFVSPKATDSILDLYCGVGFFSLDLARNCKQVIGIESNSEAIRAAKRNAKANEINNAFFINGDAKKAIFHTKRDSFDTIVLDPARAGCDMVVLSQIISFNPSKIVYISCSPDTQVRDARFLIDAGYKIDICQPLDMFPNTYHIENIIRLVKKD